MAHRAGRQVATSPQRQGALRVKIRGIVQGVGFRPFIYRLTQQHQLNGWVRNTSWGVEIEIEGEIENLDAFVRNVPILAPPIAHVESLESERIAPSGYQCFEIRHSRAQAGAYQLIPPDIATCADCQREICDPTDRRYRYPFTNCTNCGPRFTIIEDVPYDRPRTTMRDFCMCPDCQREYDDPLDRRFHAQPNACPECGPQVTLCDSQGNLLAERDEAMRRASLLLRQGKILAVKGLGGFQLACDATSEEAVQQLRQRKRRPHKPFAVMVADLAMAERHALLSDAERELLQSTAAPIVLLSWREASNIARAVGPDTRKIGIMLPYTPLHHVLLADTGVPLVMTSGNLSEEPIARDNDEALRRLGRIADFFLLHNRGIYARYDDSVWFVPSSGSQPMRRARGYAPFPIRLPFKARPMLACGAELKNTFCLTRDEYAFLSQHIGDMQNLETLEHYGATIALYQRLFHVQPELIVCDMHPDYEATRYGQSLPGDHLQVQHHHAHLAACLADNGCHDPVIGVIMDGTGLGLDGQIWGGEFLVGDGRGFQRAAHLEYLPLPGGDQAVRKPYRIALAYLRALLGDADVPPTLQRVPEQERRTLALMVERGLNTPLTSSAGRLFDAVSALLGICQEVSYEAQAAIRLEMAAHGVEDRRLYRYDVASSGDLQVWGRTDDWTSRRHEVFLAPLFADILRDMTVGVAVNVIALRFHRTMAQMIADVAGEISEESGLRRVALSGGCFQNRLLLSLAVPLLRQRGLEVLLHRQVPTNDGGISLGQALVGHYLDYSAR